MLIMNKIIIFLTSFTTVKVDEKKKLKKNNYSSMKGIQESKIHQSKIITIIKGLHVQVTWISL